MSTTLGQEVRQHLIWMLPCGIGAALVLGASQLVITALDVLNAAPDASNDLSPETLRFRAKIVLTLAPVLGLCGAWSMRIGLRKRPHKAIRK